MYESAAELLESGDELYFTSAELYHSGPNRPHVAKSGCGGKDRWCIFGGFLRIKFAGFEIGESGNGTRIGETDYERRSRGIDHRAM